jgi:hypothetical protein
MGLDHLANSSHRVAAEVAHDNDAPAVSVGASTCSILLTRE